MESTFLKFYLAAAAMVAGAAVLVLASVPVGGALVLVGVALLADSVVEADQRGPVIRSFGHSVTRAVQSPPR
jgi:hypothetical protein